MLLFIKQNLWLPVTSALFLLVAVVTPDPLISTAFLFCLFIVWGCALADYVYNFSELKTTELPMKAVILDYDLIYSVDYHELQLELPSGKRLKLTVAFDNDSQQANIQRWDNAGVWNGLTQEEKDAVWQAVHEHFED